MKTIKAPQATAELIKDARDRYAVGSDNDIEIDDNATMSQADNGTWISAWVWIGTVLCEYCGQDCEENCDEAQGATP